MADALGNLAEPGRSVRASDFDLVVAVSPENVRCLGEVFISPRVDIHDRLALIVRDGERDPAFVQCQVEKGFARQEFWVSDNRTFREFVTSPIDLLAGVIGQPGAGGGHGGIELDASDAPVGMA
ncbi:MAG: hypothetical protein OXE86_09615 [Alphaproteobacteria bacterium]|nr:hypothetical protein [Alphaproteobacteria bacterium]